MKRISALLAAALLLSTLTGCGGTDKQVSTAAENEEEAVLTIRVVNESAVNLHSIAANYSADGKILGSKACERIKGNTAPTGYDFEFLPAELPADPIGVFQIDVYAAEKAGEDYSACGSATINDPQAGTVYTLTLSGDSLTGLILSSTEKAVKIASPGKAGSSDRSPDAFVGSWHLADSTDLGTLSEVFPGAAEFGSGMEIRSDGGISWYVGADGATGTYDMDGNVLVADVTGELDGAAHRVTLTQPEPEKLTMTFKEIELVWTCGEGNSLRGED